jgi:hypothetical protein
VAVRTRVEPLDRDVSLLIDELLSPQAQSKQFAAAAQVFLNEADETNLQVLGRVPRNKTFVDGREGAALSSVRPDGVIVREYELVIDLLVFIADELRAVSPHRSGRYQKSHTLFADGTEVPPGAVIPDANEYVFLSDAPYARKIEGAKGRAPESPMAPRGVYQITALKANARYSNLAKIKFVWRSPFHPYGGVSSKHWGKRGAFKGGQEWETRVPAILVTLGA